VSMPISISIGMERREEGFCLRGGIVIPADFTITCNRLAGRSAARASDQIEQFGHRPLHEFGLCIKFLGRGGALFGSGGVALGHLVHLADRSIDLANALGLLLSTADGFGGQSLNSAGIENWIGTKSISGFDLAKALEGHVRAQQGLEIMDGDLVVTIEKKSGAPVGQGFAVTTKNGSILETKYILITAGSRRKRLGVPGEDQFDGKGVVFCTTCDAPLFGGKTVAVVGGGNSALESVMDLIPYASKIYLLIRSEVLKGDPVTQEKVKSHPNMEIILGAVVQEIVGKGFVTGLRYQDVKTNESKELAVEGVFVEIGLTPNADFLNGVEIRLKGGPDAWRRVLREFQPRSLHHDIAISTRQIVFHFMVVLRQSL